MLNAIFVGILEACSAWISWIKGVFGIAVAVVVVVLKKLFYKKYF